MKFSTNFHLHYFVEIDPENASENALTALRKIVENLSSEPGGEILKSMRPAELRTLLRMLNSQNSEINEEYDYFEEYMDEY